jgi:hypothetical protein
MAGAPPDLPGGIDWPGILADIAEVAGPMAALRVAGAKGGINAYIPLPERLRDDHWLVLACGWEGAVAVAARLGNGVVPVPLGPFAGNRAAIRRAIREGLAAGLSGWEIARRTGVTDRTVRNHKRQDPAQAGYHPDQHRLF